uniref:Aminotransferase-like n=1 Tax=Oryza australiensis TaxID=4532 RepID=A0A1V1H7S9_9ORYZ|nr:aminotransferase-like [Oryza australiensis]
MNTTFGTSPPIFFKRTLDPASGCIVSIPDEEQCLDLSRHRPVSVKNRRSIELDLGTNDASPPHISNTRVAILYAPGVLSGGCGLAPSIIGFHAPKVAKLLHGQTRAPLHRPKRATPSAAATPAAEKRKRASKKSKTTPADDLPLVDPDVDATLEEEVRDEEMEQAVNAAAAEMSSSDKQRNWPPRRKRLLLFREPTPTAAGDGDAEDVATSVPAIRSVVDLLDFDLSEFLDPNEGADKAMVVSDEELRATLSDVAKQLECSLDFLLADIIAPATFMEAHRHKFERAKQRIDNRRENQALEATIKASQQEIIIEKAKFDALKTEPIAELDRLRKRREELIAELADVEADIVVKEQRVAGLPKDIEDQRTKIKAAMSHLSDMARAMKLIPGNDAADTKAIEEIDGIRRKAISAITTFLLC